MKKRIFALVMSFVLVFGMVACGGKEEPAEVPVAETEKVTEETAEAPTKAPTKAYRLGFSNSFNGNTYRQAMEGYAQAAADELIANGEVEELVFAEANNDAQKQIQQIQNFILEGMDAIIIDPISATALTDVIQEASDAGIPCIIVNDGPVESDAELCYQINFDTIDQMATLTEYVCEAIGGKGKIIELRGTAGAEFDNIAHEGVMQTLEKYPDIEVVAEIYTDWTGSKAQTELASVLPTLDQVDGIVTQGGDSYAAVQAFEEAGRELPVIGGDNRGYFLKWWANEAPEGYDTLSVSSNPYDGASAVYVAVDVLSGNYEIPKDMTHPFGVVTANEVQDFADVADEEICCPTYDREWVRENLYKK